MNCVLVVSNTEKTDSAFIGYISDFLPAAVQYNKQILAKKNWENWINDYGTVTSNEEVY